MNSLMDITMNDIIQLVYLIAAIAFMLGIKYLSSPATARKGNLLQVLVCYWQLSQPFLMRILLAMN